MKDEYRLIKFYADWCVPCKAMTPIYEEFAKEKNIPLESRNIADAQKTYLDAMNIKSIPTICLMKNDLLFGSITGKKTQYELLLWVNEIIKKDEKKNVPVVAETLPESK